MSNALHELRSQEDLVQEFCRKSDGGRRFGIGRHVADDFRHIPILTFELALL